MKNEANQARALGMSKAKSHSRCAKAISGCIRAITAEQKKTEKVRNAGMKTLSIILNRYQDIEDIFDNKRLNDSQKLRKIRKLNEGIGKYVGKYLPG